MHAIITFTKEDLLTNCLFVVSKSKLAKRTRNRGVIFLTVWFLLLAAWCFYEGDMEWTGYCIGLACVTFILLPFLQKNIYKKIYNKHTNEKFEKLKNAPFDITLTPDSFIYKSIFSDVTLNTSQIENITETGNHFFVKFNSQDTITLPKRSFDYQELNNLLKDIAKTNNIEVNRELNWRWK
ncbi:YcxB family protein [Mucilaginibacter aquatilis]|uniref:YcxB-like C-terminal domain-containing protein n=1 Tax=Mucilaginibacter aquatilis TaxID=1517760 RepID=A0A6I4I9J8_9SPHI|nr:YcxB family protein [Mucilaginibacter aquatilis]MVN90139.1 hypothetical protein [Mucilaginibacter aquatilis]